MVKRLLVAGSLLAVFTFALQAQVAAVWEKHSLTTPSSTKPVWMGAASTERGIAYGFVGGNHRVFVASRFNGTFIVVVDAATGDSIKTLDATGISGGTNVINDVEVSDDGHIFVSNLTTNASTSAFKVYQWTSEAAAPSVAVSYSGAAVRMGDKITVTGSVSDNSAIIWAASGTTGAGNANVYKFGMSVGSFSSDPAVIALSDNVSGGNPSVGPLPDGSFYFNYAGINPKKYSSTGTLLGTVAGSTIATGSTSIRFIKTDGSDDYVVTHSYGTGTNDERGNIVKVTGGTPINNASNEVIFGRTEKLGSASSAGNSDLDVRDNGDGTFTVYVLGTNLGFGAYETNTSPLPVQFTSLTARAIAAGAEIAWSTASEVDNAGFEVERRSISEGGMRIADYQKVGFVAGAGTSTSPRDYSYTDAPAPGRYAYRLKQIDRDGSSTYYGEAEVVVGAAPMSFSLGEAYPNPFNPATTIEFTVPQDGFASLKVYNMLGSEVATLFNGQAKAGFVNRATFDATNLTSGIYVYRLQTGGLTMARRMMLVK